MHISSKKQKSVSDDFSLLTQQPTYPKLEK